MTTASASTVKTVSKSEQRKALKVLSFGSMVLVKGLKNLWTLSETFVLNVSDAAVFAGLHRSAKGQTYIKVYKDATKQEVIYCLLPAGYDLSAQSFAIDLVVCEQGGSGVLPNGANWKIDAGEVRLKFNLSLNDEMAIGDQIIEE
jgi:hypothetical protein